TGDLRKGLEGGRKVCFVTGSREHQLDETQENGLSTYKTLLERDNYQVEPVSLIEKTEVPKDCTVLVIAGARLDYTPNEVTAIKNYVENGGRAMFLVDPPLDFGKEHIAKNESLIKLLGS